MFSFYVILTLTFGLIAYLIAEYRLHQRRLLSIPHRIHVNGTRGKSSVTRLIGAGLRAGGITCITKVTGTYPRLVMADGTEAPIHRKEKANILEQLNVVRFCTEQKAQVLLIECMALQPDYQRITEKKMIKATVGVITNIRMDHLDVMGPTLDDVANAICNTIPSNSELFTAEDRYITMMTQVAKKNNTAITQSVGDTVSDEDMDGFSYLEHKENVALALDICEHFGVGRDIALAEMHLSQPDEGVLRVFSVKHDGKEMHFYNALAANDPESSLIVWNSIMARTGDQHLRMVILNSRKDRQDRAIRLSKMISELEFDKLALIGETVEMVENMCVSNGIPKEKIVAIGMKPTEEQFSSISDNATEHTTIVAFGNMGAGGAELSKMFENLHNGQLKHT